MSNIKVSIIVPVYNAEKYLHECIKSLLSQTFRSIEVILVDDGSTDSSLMICRQYENKTDIPMRVIHQENCGSTIARKNGVLVAEGEYIGFVDADDFVNENMYADLYSKAQACAADIAVCGISYLKDNAMIPSYSTIKSGVYRSEKLQQLKDTACMDGRKKSDRIIYPSLCNKIIKKESLIKHLEDIQDRLYMGDDWIISYPCIWDADTLVLIDECHYVYRYNTEGMTKAYNNHMWEDINKLFAISMGIKEKYAYQRDDYYRSYFQYMLLLCIINETKLKENGNYFHMCKKLKYELNSSVAEYSFKGTVTWFSSALSNIILALVKLKAFNALALITSLKVKKSKHRK